MSSSYEYPLHLVAAAVAAGASQISVELDRSRLAFSCNAPTELSADDLRGSGCLSRGIDTALRVASRVKVSAGHQEWSVDGRGVQATETATLESGWKIEVSRKRRWIPFLSATPEAKILEQRCRRCPARLELNGRDLTEPPDWPDCLATLHLHCEARPLRMRRGSVPIASKVSFPDFSVILGVLAHPTREATEFVVDGVSYFRSLPRWPAGVRAVVAAPMAPGDNLISQLHEQVEQAEQLLLKRFDSLELGANQILELCARFETQLGRMRPAERTAVMTMRLKAMEGKLGPTHPQVQRALEELAEHYHSLGEYARAKPLLNRLAARKAEQFMDKRRLR